MDMGKSSGFCLFEKFISGCPSVSFGMIVISRNPPLL